MKFHIVRNGETLKQIAFLYGLGEEELQKENKHIRVWGNLVQGTKLKIPTISEAIDLHINAMEPFVEDYYPKLKLGDEFNIENIEKQPEPSQYQSFNDGELNKHENIQFQKFDASDEDIEEQEEVIIENEKNPFDEDSSNDSTQEESNGIIIHTTTHSPIKSYHIKTSNNENVLKEDKKAKRPTQKPQIPEELQKRALEEDEEPYPNNQYYAYPRYVYPRQVYPVYVYPKWRY